MPLRLQNALVCIIRHLLSKCYVPSLEDMEMHNTCFQGAQNLIGKDGYIRISILESVLCVRNVRNAGGMQRKGDFSSE